MSGIVNFVVLPANYRACRRYLTSCVTLVEQTALFLTCLRHSLSCPRPGSNSTRKARLTPRQRKWARKRERQTGRNALQTTPKKVCPLRNGACQFTSARGKRSDAFSLIGIFYSPPSNKSLGLSFFPPKIQPKALVPSSPSSNVKNATHAPTLYLANQLVTADSLTQTNTKGKPKHWNVNIGIINPAGPGPPNTIQFEKPGIHLNNQNTTKPYEIKPDSHKKRKTHPKQTIQIL